MVWEARMTKKENKVAKQNPKERRYRDPAEWLADLKRFGAEPLLPEGRNQPILRGNIEAEKERFFKLADQLSTASDPAKQKRIKEALARVAFGK
jgi:hypothetical protein